MRPVKVATQVAAAMTLLFPILCGVATSPASGQGKKPKYLVGQAYRVKGRTYYPRDDLSYDRVGVASWYGPGFHGRRTANGETYNMNAMTAAHPTLPLSTMVRVTNLANDRSIMVRINDRGPFAGDRIIDLSHASAQALGFVAHGVTRVRVTVLREATLRVRQGGKATETVEDTGGAAATTSSRPRPKRAHRRTLTATRRGRGRRAARLSYLRTRAGRGCQDTPMPYS